MPMIDLRLASRSFLDINYENWRLNLVGDGIAMKYLKDLVDLLDCNQIELNRFEPRQA